MDNQKIDIFEKLRLLEIEANSIKKYYFYYDPATMFIVHVRNYLEQDQYPYVEITEDRLPFKVGEINIGDLMILDQGGEYTIISKPSVKERYIVKTIDSIIFKVSKITAKSLDEVDVKNYDLLIEQDDNRKEFRIRLTSKNFKIKEDFKMLVYVTAENDPNILYKSLYIDFNKLLDYTWYTVVYDDFKGSHCSVFFTKYLENYLHVVIE